MDCNSWRLKPRLSKPNLPTQVQRQSAQADIVCIAALAKPARRAYLFAQIEK